MNKLFNISFAVLLLCVVWMACNDPKTEEPAICCEEVVELETTAQTDTLNTVIVITEDLPVAE